MVTMPSGFKALLPLLTSTAPINPPKSECDELAGIPGHHVISFHKMAASTAAATTETVTAYSSTKSRPIVLATAVPKRNGPINSAAAAISSARRAAGIAIGEYLGSHDLPNPGSSAYDRLQFLSTLSGLPPRVIEICEHLLLRVNEEFKLPIEANLIAETKELAKLLLGEN